MGEFAGGGARGQVRYLGARCRFVLWLVSAVERFPRGWKFRPGDHIQSAVLKFLIEATYARAARSSP